MVRPDAADDRYRLVLALASTILVNTAYLREHDAAARLIAFSSHHPIAALHALLTDRVWVGAFAMETVGFALYVAALALAPLALVQSVGVGGIGLLAVGSARLAHRRLTRRERLGTIVSVLGLLLLALSLISGSARDSPGSVVAISLWLAAGVVVAAAVLVAAARRHIAQGAEGGVAGGLLFAIGDLSTKAATQGGARIAFATTVVAGYALGTSLLQAGYQHGAALSVAGLATLLTNALPIVAGTVVLHEAVPGSALGVLRVLAFVAVIAGAILLARGETKTGTTKGAR